MVSGCHFVRKHIRPQGTNYDTRKPAAGQRVLQTIRDRRPVSKAVYDDRANNLSVILGPDCGIATYYHGQAKKAPK